MSTEESDAKFLNDAFVFSELFEIISRDLLQAVCKGLEQIYRGNSGEQPERRLEWPDGRQERANTVRNSAHFLSALPEAPKCVKPIRFVYPDLDLEKSLHLRFSHRSPTIVTSDPGSHRGESAPILAF